MPARRFQNRNGFILVALAPAAGVAVALADWLSVATHGSDGPKIALEIAFLVSIVAIPIAAFLCIFKRCRPWGGRVLLAASLYIAASAVGSRIGRSFRADGFQRIATNGCPLIDGIKAYIRIEGEPPPSLDALIPEYLSELPTTGIAAYPRYMYWEEQNGTWRVFVPVGSGLDWGSVVYSSSQIYPESWQRFGEWAVVPD